MKQFLLIFTLVALLFGLSGAQDDTMPDDETMEKAQEEMMSQEGHGAMMEETEAMVDEMVSSSEPTAEELAGQFLGIINNQSYEYSWHYEPGVAPGFYEGTAPHGALLRAFTNNIAYDAIIAKVNPLPVGSIIVKENYMPDRTLGAITYMVKLEDGTNPDAGDWFWAKMKPDGTVEAAGAPAGCVGCHGAQSANGWIFNASLQ